MESIQDLLTSLGFIVNGESFVRGAIVIPFSSLEDEIESFRRKAIEKGWLAADRSHPLTRGTDYSDTTW